MTSQSAEAPPGSTEHGGLRLSPEAAYEVPVILQLTINSRVHVVGGVRKGLEQPANVMVLLGTKVSDGHPSCIGFRVLLRTETPKAKDSDSIEDHYHAVSCRFDPQGGKVTYAKVTSKDKEELMSTKPFRETFTEELKASTDQDLYHMRFITSDTNGFIISHHGPNLRSTDVYVRKIEKLMQFIAYASQLSMYFIADKILIKYLARTLKHDCVGTEAPSWKDALPDSSIIRWPSNVQTQMVSGSTDVLNVLLNAFREQPLRDGPGTSVKDRPEAEQFKAFVRQSYPAIRQEPANKVYPIMLNVSNQGPCIELPFGASLVNRTNTYTTINALHRLIAINLAASRIGIVTLYPAQVEIYKDALDRCHKYAPDRGYNLVQVDLLENWVQKTVGIVIVDLVRTPNASGNLGYLSQAYRLKVLLSLHHNGLIIVGDRTCTVTSHGTVTSAKLERILEWFVDHGRIVQMSDKGQPLPILPMAPAPTQPSPMVPLPSQKPSDSSTFRSPASSVSGLESDTPAPRRRYVGIPGLEHLKLDKPFTENTRAPIDSRGRSAAQTSYVRQGFPTRESSRSFDKPSNEEAASFVPDVNTGSQSERLHPDDYLSFARQGSSTPLDPKSVAKGGLGTFDIPTMKTKTTNKKPRDLAIATAPGKLEQASIPANLPSKTTLQGPRSRETKGGDLTPPSMDSNAHQDSDSPFRKAIKRHKEEATKDGSNKTLGESSSKLSFQSGTALPASQSMPVAESPHAITGASIPLKSAGKENVPPQTAAQPSSSQPHRTKVKETSPGKSDPKLPPHKAVMRLSTQDSSISATKQQGPHKNGLPAPALRVSSPPAASSLVPHQASTSTNSSGAASKVASVSSLSAPTLVRALNFKSRYQPKYRAIRASFKNMDSDISRTPQEEDRLFRCLADAFMDEDDNAFDNAYTDLLGLSAKLQTSVLRREGDQRRLMH